MRSEISLTFWLLVTLLPWSPFIAVTAQIPPTPSLGEVDASLACRFLQQNLSHRIVTLPGHPQYTNATHSAWNVFNTEFMPACIVFPRDASHVQAAMKTIYEHRVRYAVQAGGHSAMKGWNSVQNGILIMFTFMNNMSYDPKRDTITVLPGVRWGDAADGLERFGVAPVGGRVSGVGTGLLLGDGRLVTATVNNEYRDLFKALKGGANRFGVVTRYEVTAIHTGRRQDKWWFGGMISYSDSATEGFLRATANFVRENRDSNAAMLTSVANIVSPETQNVTSLPFTFLFYDGGKDTVYSAEKTERLFNASFSQFLSLPRLSSSLTPLSYIDVAHMLDEGPAQLGQGQLFGASAFASDDPIQRYLEAVQFQRRITEQFKDILNTTLVAFTPVLDEQIYAGRKRGGNAFDPPLGGYNAVQYQVSVNPGATSRELALLNNARRQWFRNFPPTPGLPLYINECDKEQEVFKTYGQYEFLKRIYAKYDPTSFNVKFSDGPSGL
ncbi:hypothetical protein E1B28_005807 [Marasmius oreades]|uniref:FAD-binding PCMH-type domain-containing protein n=1 Tax=Marasmius oreades TaxID=181124 RepID=A0A9P7UUM8_9AGAR|nr:uncharacterized protein E1B28_005807 [Marasmius oreades]KAG7095012.1 hypothetical protein E1B28_005807 [Marasmius oreades]